MSRLDAVTQYDNALKAGKKYYNNALSKGEDPYPEVLDEKINLANVSSVNIGLVDIPIDRIVGTYTGGRKNAFAGNYMPLMDPKSEFGQKWINLCNYQMNEGIADPILCYEYLGNFYVQEGNKRVSVLKSLGATDITGTVYRLIPQKSDDPDIKLYFEFLDFYKLSKLYTVSFTQPGSYQKLQAAIGLEPDQVWPEEVRRSFNSRMLSFSNAYDQLNNEKLPLTAGDALLVYLKVHPYSELQEQSDDEIKRSLDKIWPDIRLLAKGEPISVSTEPEEKGKSLLNIILGTPRLDIAFIYDFDPQKYVWAAAHYQGQKYLEEKLGSNSSISIKSYLCEGNVDEVMTNAVRKGANVLFVPTPTLIDNSRRIAAENKDIAVFNCALSMPYAGVRSYYCRIYEAKFIAGAIAGAMADKDHIGYIANYPIMGSTSAINAFALGAQITNPRAKISLKWTCVPGDPILALRSEGINVFSNRDTDAANELLPWGSGIYIELPGGTYRPLAAPRWNWGIYYEKTVQSLLNSGIAAIRDQNNAVNDWWGMSTGVVDMILDKDLPEGLKRLSDYLKNGIIRGTIDPFLTPIKDQKGMEVCDGEHPLPMEELMQMNWLCENIEGAIPQFDELLPQSRSLVRLLGLYRETIPPEVEEAVK
ncbi:MAG: BMP family ABC transporter substrate-binding protein [Anaerolineaceae bacterium]|nr:BMP family ABC transporter substrate-binding protein [Anaerolineaceae bacterium]